MSKPEIIHPGGGVNTPSSWLGAYFRFLGSSSESRALKLSPLVLVGLVPASILDDLVLPGLGLIDNIPVSLLAIIILVLTLNRVRRYR